MDVQFTVAGVEAGVATLVSPSLHQVFFPRRLLPADATEGSVVAMRVSRDTEAEQRKRDAFLRMQKEIVRTYGVLPELGRVDVKARTQTTVTLTWEPPTLHGAILRGIEVIRDRAHVKLVQPDQLQVKLTGLVAETAYDFVVVFKTSAARLTSPPLRVSTRSMRDFSGLLVAFSLFSPQEMNELRQLVLQLGGQFTETFTQDNTHLVCKAPAGARYEQAGRWNIPAVGPEWLRECRARGTLPSAHDHYAEKHVISAYFPSSIQG